MSSSQKGKIISKEQRDKLSKLFKGRKLSKESNESISARMSGENNPNRNKRWLTNGNEELYVKSDKFEELLNIGWVFGRSSITKTKQSEQQLKRPTRFSGRGRVLSEETKQKIGEKSKGRKWTQYHYDVMSNLPREVFQSTKNKICINNGLNNKYIYPTELESFISDGWVRGMLRRKKDA